MTPQQHLELICKYLPHKVLYSHSGNVAELMPYHLGMHLKNIERGDDWKLVLRPLSDLIKPCLKGGKVPIEELEELEQCYVGINFIGLIIEQKVDHEFIYVTDVSDKLLDKLHQWHFFLGDQSLFGKEIIDINTLK